MLTKKIFLLLSLVALVSSCSKDASKTSAKLNLKLSGIVNLTSGIGSGGAILFGKSSTGEQFGKVVNGSEINLEINNGDWSFYTVMWEKTSGNNLSDVVYCGKSSEKLAGSAVSINLNLNNNNCDNSDFSGGTHFSQYVSGSGFKNTFAKFFVEDCDDLSQTGNITCLKSNQGSALSYRVNFRSYTKSPAAGPVFSDEIIRSQCVNVNTLHTSGMNINFPTSNSAMPFVTSVEMYLGSTDCAQTQSETKGMYTHVLPQGLGVANPGSKIVYNGGYSCTPSNSILADVCASFMGTMSGSVCSVASTVSNFVSLADCSMPPPAPTVNTVRNIKQMISVPKEIFCFADVSNIGASGTDVFPAGDGSEIRPFKICNEWQINQIGEFGASPLMSTYHYKLLKDLDMNKTDFGPYPKPTCSGVTNSIIDRHHNLNSLDGLFGGDCQTVNSSPSFTGSFNGNDKTISHARISADKIEKVGFVRRMVGGAIKNLNFINLDVRGSRYVGGIVGVIDASSPVEIRNIKIKGLDIEAKFNSTVSNSGFRVGAIAGQASKGAQTNTIEKVNVSDAKIYGTHLIGGLIGLSEVTIFRSSFSGLIKAHGSISDSWVGGLVGYLDNANIVESFSEGVISSNAKYIGGLVAKSENGSSISNSYSTMFLDSYSGQPDSAVGGIIGYNQSSSSYSDVYFDGLLVFKGSGSSPSIHPIANGSPSISSVGVCLYSVAGYASGDCFPIVRMDLMNPSSFSAKPAWIHNQTGILPRLVWEDLDNSRICLKTGNNQSVQIQQSTLSRGAVANPIVVCNASQLANISSLSAGSNIILGENINLSDWSDSSLISNFSGVFDGRDHGIYGLKILTAPFNSSGIAIIKNNNGTIKNLSVVGNTISSNIQMPYSGILTAKNSGVIKDIIFYGNSLQGYDYVGAVSGLNSGTIDQVESKQNNIDGHSYVGGLVGQNTISANNLSGKILRSYSESNLKDRSVLFPDYTLFGGVVGENCLSCLVDQVEYAGMINLVDLATTNPPYIGGIVGHNLGSVSNALLNNRSQISTKNNNKIGGIAGLNSGNISKSLALGRVVNYPVDGLPMPGGSLFSALIGSPVGSSSNLYFLKNQVGTIVGQGPTNTTCSGTEASFSSPFFALGANTPDLYLRSYYSYYNNSLSSLSPLLRLTDVTMTYLDNCNSGDFFTFIKSHGPVGMEAIDFLDPVNFPGLNMGYPGHMEENILEYHKARMYNRAPAMELPAWVLEEGDSYPRLLQVND